MDETGLHTYPDVIVACGPVFDEDSLDTLLNPLIAIKIPSPSTEDYDKGPKSACCTRLSSIHEVWFVAQEQTWIERNRRIGPVQRLRERFTGAEMRIKEPNIMVALSKVYECFKLAPNSPLHQNAVTFLTTPRSETSM